MLRYLLLLAAMLGLVNFGATTPARGTQPHVMDGGGGGPSPKP